MKTIEITLYKFSELSEKAKQKAVENLCNINIAHDWWEFVYEDAKNVGIKINEFDIDGGNYCKGEFLLSASEVAQNTINNHGEQCDTYQTAQDFLNRFNPLFALYMDESSEHYESGEIEADMIEEETDFLNFLLEDYRVILSQQYDFLTSEKSIIETIEANDYNFTEDGELY